MKDIELSIRMKAVADMTVTGHAVADIGCDHAFVPVYLVQNKISPKVIASDVRSGPCEIAKANITKYGCDEVIELRIGDGLSTIGIGEVETIIIAGMGGMLINDILNDGYEVADSAAQLILQPQSDLEKVRRNIVTKGWQIVSEKMCIDMGKYYTILNVSTVHTQHEETSDVYMRYGEYLISEGNPILYKYLKEKYDANIRLMNGLHNSKTEKSMLRYEEINNEQKLIEEAVSMIEMHIM